MLTEKITKISVLNEIVLKVWKLAINQQIATISVQSWNEKLLIIFSFFIFYDWMSEII